MPKLINKIILSNYTPVKWAGQVVYSKYTQIVNFLNKEFGEKYSSLLAEPYIPNEAFSGSIHAKWFVKDAKNPRKLSDVPENEQKQYLNKLSEFLSPINDFIKQNKSIDNRQKRAWANILEGAFTIPSVDFIFVDEDGNFFLTGWGLSEKKELLKTKSIADHNIKNFPEKEQPRLPIISDNNQEIKDKQTNSNELAERYKQDKHQDEIDTETNQQTNQQDNDLNNDKIIENTKSDHYPISSNQQTIKNKEKKEDKLEDTYSADDLSEDNNNKKNNDFYDEKKDKKIEQQNSNLNTQFPNEDTANSSDKDIADKINEEKIQSDNTTSPPPPSPPITKRQKTWWKRFWWICLLLLLLLILCLIFCRHHKQTFLPPEPGIIPPVDTTKIGPDPDTVRTIITDRINVALLGDNKDINKFAREFKKIYKEEQYKIIYYNDKTYRLQLQIPANEREKIKKDLPRKLPDFKMLIWDESLFDHDYIPSDPDFSDDKKSWYFRDIEVFDAWNITKGDSNIVIAVVDDGCDLNHPELKDKIYKPWNIIENSSNVYADKNHYHGTHVAGLIVSSIDNSVGVAGIAPICKIMPVQVADRYGNLTSTAIIDGILYAINNGADIINISLGTILDPRLQYLPISEQEQIAHDVATDEAEFWKKLFLYAYEQNIILVIAAGNDNILINVDPMKRSDKAIYVSATDINDKKAQFSNFGDFSTISAPGVNIYSLAPYSSFTFMDGTSMAAPIVSGAVALIKSVNSTLTIEQIVELLQNTGKPIYGHIGNLIQLGNAVSQAYNYYKRTVPHVSCPDIKRKIDSLYLEIQKLQNICLDSNEYTSPADTMLIPSDTTSSDLDFAKGHWRSTYYLSNTEGDSVYLYFTINLDGTGTITLVEKDGGICEAPLNIEFKKGTLLIDQKNEAICNISGAYNPYIFKCVPDEHGKAQCHAQNKVKSENNFDFSLIKIH